MLPIQLCPPCHSTFRAVSGVRPPRLSRAKAEELLTDLADRAEAHNLKPSAPVRIVKILAFGAINGEHERVQDVDLGVQVEPGGEGPIMKTDQDAAWDAISKLVIGHGVP